MTALAAEKTAELAVLATEVRAIVVDTAHDQALADIDLVRARAAAATAQALRVAGGDLEPVADPNSRALAWPAVLPDGLSFAFAKTLVETLGDTVEASDAIGTGPGGLLWAGSDGYAYLPTVPVATLQRNRGSLTNVAHWEYVHAHLSGKPAELACLADTGTWADLTEATREQVVRAAAIIGAEMRASRSRRELAGIGVRDRKLETARRGLRVLLEGGAVEEAHAAARAEVQALIDAAAIDLTTVTPVLETRVDEAAVTEPVPGETPAGEDEVAAAWTAAYPDVTALRDAPEWVEHSWGRRWSRLHGLGERVEDLIRARAAAGITEPDPVISDLLRAAADAARAADAGDRLKSTLVAHGFGPYKQLDLAALESGVYAAGTQVHRVSAIVVAQIDQLHVDAVTETKEQEIATGVRILSRISARSAARSIT